MYLYGGEGLLTGQTSFIPGPECKLKLTFLIFLFLNNFTVLIESHKNQDGHFKTFYDLNNIYRTTLYHKVKTNRDSRKCVYSNVRRIQENIITVFYFSLFPPQSTMRVCR